MGKHPIMNYFLAVLLLCLTMSDLVIAQEKVQVKGQAAKKLVVYSVNYPLHYFTQRIGGSIIQPAYILPDSIDPAFWEPNTSEIQVFQHADLILLNGAGYAKWVQNTSLPRRKTIDTSKSFKHDLIHEKKQAIHNHGVGGIHSHSGKAFTTWMDITQANKQAKAIKEALVKKLPHQKQKFEDNYTLLSKDLITLDKQWEKLFKPLQGHIILASHPIYQYLARRYQLQLNSLQWEPDHYPDEVQWHTLENIINEYPISYMLWEDKPLNRTKEHLNALGITVIVFSQAGNKMKPFDWLATMNSNTKSLKQAIK